MLAGGRGGAGAGETEAPRMRCGTSHSKGEVLLSVCHGEYFRGTYVLNFIYVPPHFQPVVSCTQL
jgi:hypothetical protein